MPVAGNPWNGDRASVGNGSGRRLGCERAHGHARAMGGDDGWRAEILGLGLEGPVDPGPEVPAKPRKKGKKVSVVEVGRSPPRGGPGRVRGYGMCGSEGCLVLVDFSLPALAG